MQTRILSNKARIYLNLYNNGMQIRKIEPRHIKFIKT